ncbi:hypothetical protein AGMMS50212_16330 [Spirochaetia bacterium]|nr:hypothetical protein AGMMS50212_16330 [Spirochaetia bacterium]
MKIIINNARILSKDKLNRFLIDRNTYEYFNRFCNGIENIPIINLEKLKKVLNISQDIDSFYLKNWDDHSKTPYKYIIVQKLDETSAKNTKLSIYNLHIQLYLAITNTDENGQKHNLQFYYSIGNTNTNSLL